MAELGRFHNDNDSNEVARMQKRALLLPDHISSIAVRMAQNSLTVV